MFRKIYKKLLIFGIAITLLTVPSFWFLYSAGTELEVSFLNVGQGDSILIETPFGQNILIDGGPDNSVIKELGENLPWWDKQIDLMILTHPHDDHVTGLIDVIKRYKVEQILYTGVNYNSPNYLEWLELIKNKKIPLIIVDHPQKIIFGNNCFLEILYPNKNFSNQELSNLNNSSIVAKLDCKKNKFLFMGDAESEIENELIENKIELSADVLKAGHHGSDTSSSENFLKTIKPDITIIQVGENNFGHPSRRIINKLERLEVKIFRNDEQGTISLYTDNYELLKK